MLTYPLMFYIPFTLVWQQVKKIWGPFKKPLFYEHSLRLVLVFITCEYIKICKYVFYIKNNNLYITSLKLMVEGKVKCIYNVLRYLAL